MKSLSCGSEFVGEEVKINDQIMPDSGSLFQYDGVQQESSCHFGHRTQMNLISFS